MPLKTRVSRIRVAGLIPPAGAILAAGIAMVELVARCCGPATINADAASAVMVPAAAIGVLLAAIALWLARSERGGFAGVGQRSAAAAAVILGIVSFVRYWIGAGHSQEWWAHLPGPMTCAGLIFIGASLIAPHTHYRWAIAGASAALVLAVLGLLGHAYEASLLYGLNRFGGTAVSTAIALGALALGVISLDPSRGIATVFASDSSGAYLLRWLLPLVVLAPLILGWLALIAQEAELVDTAYGTALLVVTLIVLGVGYVLRQAHVLHEADAERARLFDRERVARQQATDILEAITDGFFAVDREWRFTYLNREAERLLRRPRKELVGRNVWAEFPEAIGATFQREYQRAMAEQETVQFEARYEPLGMWVDVRAFPSADGLSVYFRDVTTRKLAEERIRESEARFRALAENASMAVFVIDEDSKIEFANPAVERIFGYTLQEMEGRSLDMLMPPDQRPLHDAGMRQYLATGRRRIRWEDVELPGLAKDGRVIPLEISMGEFARGGHRYFTGIARDITERKQAEQALRDSEERYRLLVDMIPQHIWATEPNGYHNYFSRRWHEYTGTTAEQTEGEGWLHLLHPEDSERTMTRWQHSLRTGEPYSVEYRFRGIDGQYRWFLGQAMPLRNEAGEIIRWFGTLTDISDRKQLEAEREQLLLKERQARAEADRRREELEQVTESRARLIRGFSHDVRNPLGAADAQALLLEDGRVLGPLSEKQQQSIGRIRSGIRTSIRLLEDLVELAQAEAGELELSYAHIDVTQAAREAADEFRAQAIAKQLIIEVSAPEELQVKTDRVRLRQILGNLVSNAIKYAPQGRIKLAVETIKSGGPKPGQWVALRVIDTGPGIPRDKWQVIFQEYTRLDPRAEKGTGIGLAISRRLAQLLGGDLTVESELGRGSTFTLWLPLAESAFEPAQLRSNSTTY